MTDPPCSSLVVKRMGRCRLELVANRSYHALESYQYISPKPMGTRDSLAVAVQHALSSTVDVDVLAANVPKRGLVLEINLERIVQPVVDVRAETELPRQRDVDVLQETQVQRRAHGVLLVQDDRAATVALLQRREDLGRIVAAFGATGLHEARLSPLRRLGEGLVRMQRVGLDVRSRNEVPRAIGRLREGGEPGCGHGEEVLGEHDGYRLVASVLLRRSERIGPMHDTSRLYSFPAAR